VIEEIVQGMGVERHALRVKESLTNKKLLKQQCPRL